MKIPSYLIRIYLQTSLTYDIMCIMEEVTMTKQRNTFLARLAETLDELEKKVKYSEGEYVTLSKDELDFIKDSMAILYYKTHLGDFDINSN